MSKASRCRCIICIVFYLFILQVSNVHAAPFTKNEIKAVFLYKLTKFIRWEKEKISLCFLGDIPDENNKTIVNALEDLQGVDNKEFSLKGDIDIKDLKFCDFLFIGLEQEHNLKEVLFVTNKYKIVTLSDIPGFSKKGGMFGFIIDSNKLGVELNFTNSRKNNININSSLMDMIKVIR